MHSLFDPVIVLAAQVLLALVFIAAGIGKMRDWGQFLGLVQNYRVLPRYAVPAVAYALPPAECAIGAGLLMAQTRTPSALLAAVLLSIFAVTIAVNVLRGRTEIDCGCFRTSLKQRLSWWLVMRNLVLIALTLVIVVAADPPAAARATVWVDSVSGVVAGSVLFGLYAAANLLGTLPASSSKASAAHHAQPEQGHA